jgi:hypothetical protein
LFSYTTHEKAKTDKELYNSDSWTSPRAFPTTDLDTASRDVFWTRKWTNRYGNWNVRFICI